MKALIKKIDFISNYCIPEENQLTADMVLYELPNIGQTKGYFKAMKNTFITEAEDGKMLWIYRWNGSEEAFVQKIFKL